jgi:2-dehydro-3-deoxygluconokinase
MTDLVTFGETMLRLSPPRGELLSRMDRLDVHVGGAESNVAVAAANLGVAAAWLSVLPESNLGDRVVRALRAAGVDPVVTRTDEGRVGTYYLEHGGQPRGRTVVYDREGAPVRSATPEAFPLDRLREADAFLTTGITPALSGTLAKTTKVLLGTAHAAGTRTVFDVNYRAKLWDEREARASLVDLFPEVDVLFVAKRDAARVFDVEGDPETVAREFRDRYDFETVVLTRGEAGALAVTDEATHEQAAFETETFDPVGSGDAFVGGYLAARLADGSIPDALADGAAAAALKRTVDGDTAPLSPEAVAAVVEDGGADGISR